MPIQVQLRGGTSEEHNNFVGAEREITVDTTKHTLVVHDGVTEGGYPLPTSEDLSNVQQDLEEKINNISVPELNLDNKYAQKEHEHSDYVKKPNSDVQGILLKTLETYRGMLTENGSDVEYIRTTKSGLLPYSSGISSNIGTNNWRFSKGYFDALYTNTISSKNVTCESILNYGEYKFDVLYDMLRYNSSNGDFEFLKNNSVSDSTLSLGTIKLKGIEIFVGSEFPSHAKENDILIQI